MSVQDINQTLLASLLIVLIIGLTAISYRIFRNLGTLHLILKDTQNISDKVSNFTNHPEYFKKDIQNLAKVTIDALAEKQTYRMRKYIANNMLTRVIKLLRS